MEIKSSPNFTGFYKIPKRSDEITQLVSNCCKHKNESIIILNGDYPFIDCFEKIYENIAQENGGALNWLRNNAKNHGIVIPEINKDSTIVITTQKDILEYLKFIKKHSKSLMSNFGSFSRFKFIISDAMHINNDLPMYLKLLNHLVSVQQKYIKAYSDYLSGKNIVDVSTFEEFIQKI